MNSFHESQIFNENPITQSEYLGNASSTSNTNGAIKKTYYGKNRKFKEKHHKNNNFNNNRLKKENQPNEASQSYSGSYQSDYRNRGFNQNNQQFSRLPTNNFHQGNFNMYRKYKQNYYWNRNEMTQNQNPESDQKNTNMNQFHKNKEFRFNRPCKNQYPRGKLSNTANVASQRDRLVEMITHRTLDCLVCCEIVKSNDKIWSCKNCYHILHLKCTRDWANSSKLEEGWRCPACQNVCKDVPFEYRCFCGKSRDPNKEPGLLAHSCGEVCLRQGRLCEHRCLILCHPGPCPDCIVMVKRRCGCGKTEQQVKCTSDLKIICRNVCEKDLECGIHKCASDCHTDDCQPCSEIVKQVCFCGSQCREVNCNSTSAKKSNYSCDNICNKTLTCGNHKCDEVCHAGPCKTCIWDVNIVKGCYCGKKPLESARTSCLDVVPSCGMPCGNVLRCGPVDAPHICKATCHSGKCVNCDLTTTLRCRCGSAKIEIPCAKFENTDVRCEKKCTKKRLCGKHKCNQRCCIEVEHVCPLPCNKLLSCGNHRCQMTCHSGRCKPCPETSFEELCCECGASVIYPPVPCGTKPPSCDKSCPRTRECGHDANHTCHTLGPCPPCTVLCRRWCYGGHEQRAAIPCHQENFSCGLACSKLMVCGTHKCVKPCHLGPCPTPCTLPCTKERPICGHPCNSPCHEGPCPNKNCKAKVPVACPCGIQKSYRCCNDVIDEFRTIEMATITEQMLDMSKNQSVAIKDVVSRAKRPEVLKILECTDECRVIERNRKLAIGLQIRNPDISQKLTPRYSDFMRGWAKKDPHFCKRVHDKLTELVQLAKESKQKSRSFSFESMNRDKRQFVHEYCEHFGCESAAYDAEPNRNIVATALRDKSWLPGMSLMEVIQRENGQRKVPGPSVLGKYVSADGGNMRSLGKTVKLTNNSR